VIGQGEVRRQLAESFREGRAAHAYLLSGPDGIGKTAVALEFAQLLLCERIGPVPCGECEQCLMFRSLQHPDLKIYFPLPPKKSGSVDDEEREFATVISDTVGRLARDWYAPTRPSGAKEIRLKLVRAMLRSAALKPYQAKRKVFIVLHADTMNEESQNALLKTLEEPYVESYFLLVTDNELGLRPTIRSRCQRVRMTPLAVETIYDALTAEGIPGPRAELASRLSAGSFNHAVDLSGPDIEKVQENVLVFLRVVSRLNPLDLQDGIDALLETGTLPEHAGLEMLGLFLRDTAMLRLSGRRASKSRLAFGHLEDKVQGVISAYPQANFEEAVRVVDQSVGYLTKGYTKDLILHALAIRLHEALGTLVRTKRTVASTHE
jgi:DNA polymerase-3 subunit delta'